MAKTPTLTSLSLAVSLSSRIPVTNLLYTVAVNGSVTNPGYDPSPDPDKDLTVSWGEEMEYRGPSVVRTQDLYSVVLRVGVSEISKQELERRLHRAWQTATGDSCETTEFRWSCETL